MNNFMSSAMYLLITTLTGSLGALAFKVAMNKMEELNIINLLKSLWVWIGFTLYVISAVTNIVLLQYLDYTVVFPLTAFTYIWTIIISYFIFQEKITWQKVASVICIIIGIIFITL